MNYKAIIIDDEPKGRINLASMLQEYCANIELVGEADTVAESVRLIREKSPDILFLDIEMQEHSGFDVLDKFPVRNFEVIFVTAYNEYALKALKEQALDYILKPIDPDELTRAIVKLASRKRPATPANSPLQEGGTKQATTPAKLQIPFEKGIRFVDIDSIIRIKANNNYSELYLVGGERIICSLTLGRLEEQIRDEHFVRVHQSHLVNTRFVAKYYRTNGGQLEMSDGSNIEISRRKKDELLKILRSGA